MNLLKISFVFTLLSTALLADVLVMKNGDRVTGSIVKKDGNYHFVGLRPDIEYALRARYRNVWGEKETLSMFDSRKNAEVMLSVDEKEE